MQQLVARDGIVRERVHRMQRSRRVARTPTQPRAHRDPLGQLERHTELVSRGLEDRARPPHRQVFLGRSQVGALYREGDT